MSYNEQLADRLRKTLSHIKDVEEKKMFKGITFMVNGKMCLSVSGEDLMVRFDPKLQDEILKKKGVKPMLMKNREYKGYVYVTPDAIQADKDFNYWVELALEFNKRAKSSKKK